MAITGRERVLFVQDGHTVQGLRVAQAFAKRGYTILVWSEPERGLHPGYLGAQAWGGRLVHEQVEWGDAVSLWRACRRSSGVFWDMRQMVGKPAWWWRQVVDVARESGVRQGVYLGAPVELGAGTGVVEQGAELVIPASEGETRAWWQRGELWRRSEAWGRLSVVWPGVIVDQEWGGEAGGWVEQMGEERVYDVTEAMELGEVVWAAMNRGRSGRGYMWVSERGVGIGGMRVWAIGGDVRGEKPWWVKDGQRFGGRDRAAHELGMGGKVLGG